MSAQISRPPGGFVGLTMMVKALIRPVVFGVSAIVEDGQGRVLLARHSYRSGWHLPSGGVGRGEPPDITVTRELEEEVGLVESVAPEFLALYTQKMAWFTHLVALYRVKNARLEFVPNLEVREIQFCDPALPPDGTSEATRRRLAEYYGKTPRSSYW